MNLIIVGAGLTGATIARQLADSGLPVHIIDQRHHIAGNAFDFRNEHGIRIHRYGPHLFHTNNTRVVQYLSRFTDWLPYRHRAKALLADGRYVPFPVNRESAAAVGKANVLDVFFRPYTRKMWGVELEAMAPGVAARVPIREDDCEDYFPNDAFQALPKDGYTAMVQNLLAHDNITVSLQTPFDARMEADYDHIFNAMPIDEYYDYRFGELPYRSIRFEHRHHRQTGRVQPAAVVNFTTDAGATRQTEWKHLPGHASPAAAGVSSITREFPCDYRDNDYERYYPVKDAAGENRRIYQKYANIANAKTTFVGRCGQYVYIDMHQAVNMALATADRFIAKL